MSWTSFAEHFKETSYEPLGLDAVQEVRSVAMSNLGSPVDLLQEIRAQCPFHVSDGGGSRTLRVNLNPSFKYGIGFFKCYSCKEAGHWNKLAEHIGVDAIHVDANPVLKNLLLPIQESKDYNLPSGLQDWGDREWVRENKNNGTTTVISPYAFQVVQAKLWYRTEFKDCPYGPIDEERAWLPVHDRGQPVAHVAALLSKTYEGSKKYKNSFGDWSKKRIAFFDQICTVFRGSKTLAIVEGSADALRLIDYNIPAIPLLGVSTWTKSKASQVAAIFEHAVVCLDADNAGQPAQAQVLSTLAPLMRATGIQLQPKEDPASLPSRDFSALINKILAL